MYNRTNTNRRIWIVVGAAVVAIAVVFGINYYTATRAVEWSIIAPPQYVNTATRIAELRMQGRYDEAVDIGLHSLKGQHDEFIYQMIASTYFVRSIEDKNRSGKWARLGAEYSEKAFAANPTDVVNVFNVGLNYIAAGDDVSEGGCEYYQKAWSLFSSLAPKLEGSRAEAQGRAIRLAPLRKENQEQLDRLGYRLRHCQQSLGNSR